MIMRTIWALLLACNAVGQTWQVTEMSPMPTRVTNNALCEAFNSTGNFVYSFAGIDSTLGHDGIHLRSFRYNIDTDVWDSIPSLPDIQGKIACSASRVEEVIYIVGGYHVAPNGNETSSAKVHRYNVNTNQYLSDGMNIPTPIDDQVQAVWRDSLIFVITGWSNTGNVTDVQVYHPGADQWAAATSVPVLDNYRAFGASGTIVGDTIYYFGGAGNGNSFAARSEVRKGVINPDQPTEITWSTFELDPNVKGYRTTCTQSFGNIHWLGGSDISYNFDGISYNGTGVVSPSARNLFYNPTNGIWAENQNTQLPMDLRGIAEVSDSVKYIVGGMWDGQEVSNKTLRLEWRASPNSVENQSASNLLYPNPAINFIHIDKSLGFKHYAIFGLDGRPVLSGLIEYQINISELNSGIYIIKLNSEDGFIYQRFVKQ
ncbi:MAG: hypothetical protein ACI9FU_001596 [Granulosicoccus sp.]|jgi:hypothetical protein